MKNKSKKLVVVLVILILLAMAVAYAAVSQTLTITGTARVAADVSNVIITNIEQTDATEGATDTNDVAATYTDTTATFDVTLAEPGDYAIYTVTVKNNGNTEATLSDIAYYLGLTVGTETTLDDINSADPAGIKFEVNAPAEASTLAMGAETTVTVKAYWDETITDVAAGSSKSMTMTLLYEVPTT